MLDGEAVIARDDGTPDFHALRSKRRGHEAVLFAFDLIEHDGDDLRDLPRIERKRRLAKLLGRAKRRAIRFNEQEGLQWRQRGRRRCGSSRSQRKLAGGFDRFGGQTRSSCNSGTALRHAAGLTVIVTSFDSLA